MEAVSNSESRDFYLQESIIYCIITFFSIG